MPEDQQKSQIFAITFGSEMYGGLFKDKFSLVKAENEKEAYKNLQILIGGQYESLYPMDEEFEEKIVELGLEEVHFLMVHDEYHWGTHGIDIKQSMLDENSVVDAVANYLEANGYKITQKLKTTDQGIDIKAVKNDGESEIWVEAKGGTSSRPGSARHGKPYTASQVFDRVSKGTYTALDMRCNASENVTIALAIPDTTLFRKYIIPVLPALTKFHIKVLIVTGNQKVSELNDINLN